MSRDSSKNLTKSLYCDMIKYHNTIRKDFIMETKFCTFCGEKLPVQARFCSACGAEQLIVEKSVLNHEEPIEENKATFDSDASSCCEDDNWKNNRMNHIPAEKQKSKKSYSAIEWVSCALTLALSIVLLVMAFLPITVYRTEAMFPIEGMEFRVSAIDRVVLFFTSLHSMDAEELQDSDLMDEMEECIDEFENEFGSHVPEEYSKLSYKERDLINRYVILALRIAGMSEDSVTTPDSVVDLILVLLYFFVVLALLVFSALRLLAMFGLDFIRESTLCKWQIALFCAIPPIVAALHFNGMTFGLDFALAGGAITTLILSGILIVYHAIVAVLASKIRWNRATVMRLISLIAMIILMVTAFTPVMATEVRAVFSGKESRRTETMWLDVSYFSNWYLSENRLDEYEELHSTVTLDVFEQNIADAVEEFSAYTVKEVREGDANISNVQVLNALGMPRAFHEFSWLFALTTLLYVIAFLAMGLCMWQNLVYFTGGRYCSVVALIGKIFVCLFVALAVALIITFVVLMSSFIDEYLPSGYSYGIDIAAGGIVAVLIAMFHVFWPTKIKNIKEEMLESMGCVDAEMNQ